MVPEVDDDGVTTFYLHEDNPGITTGWSVKSAP